MLNTLKLLLGISGTSKDSLLQALIDQATTDCSLITHNTSVLGLEHIIIKMAIYNYNRLGTEGLTSESYSGFSYNYLSDYPEEIYEALKMKRKLVII